MQSDKHYDVVIIGAGVIGCSIARELSRYKLKILALEAGLDIACGATRANSGIVHAGYDPIPNTLKAKYNVAGAKMFPQLQRELGFAYFKNQALVLAFSEDDIATLEQLKNRGAQNGVDGLRIVGVEELRTLEPNVSPNAVGALLVPESGICDPYGFTYGLAESAANNGVEFKFDSPVTNIARVQDGFRITVGESAHVSASCIVNAAGVYADTINNFVSETRLKIQPKRGEYLLYKNSVHPFSRTMFQCPTEKGKGVLLTPVAFGNLICGPNSVPQDSKDDVATTAEGLADILRKGKKTWEDLSTENVINTYAGLRASNAYGNDFVIGEAPDAPGFFNAACIDSPGLASAPAIAVDLAGMVAQALHAELNENFDSIRVPAPLLVMMDEESKNELIKQNSAFGNPICKCSHVSEGELIAACHRALPVLCLDALKWRTGATMGPCQGGRCTAKIMKIMERELDIPAESIQKRVQESFMLKGGTPCVCDCRQEDTPNLFESARHSYLIPGSRPAGVYSAKCTLEMIRELGHAPGNNVAIWGNTELAQECESELRKRKAQVMKIDGAITQIVGKARLRAIEVEADGVIKTIECDTLIISNDLIEE